MNPGEIVLVRFPFSSLKTTKKRPALVLNQVALSYREQLITIAMITSKIDGLELEGDVMLLNWQSAKLLHPSLVRLAKVATIDQNLIERNLGKLSQPDRNQVSKTLTKLYHAWC